MTHYDVIVVGAGPAGLTTAAEVARTGRPVLVLDKRAGISPSSRAFGVHARTLELLDQRGLADELVATGASAAGLKLLGSAEIDLGRLPSRFAQILVTPQTNVDAMLARWAVEEGADVRRGVEVVGVRQDGDGVQVTTADGTVLEARYLVAADGVHSTVRSLTGHAFPGRAVLRSVVLADVRLTDPPSELVTVNSVADGFAFLAPFGDGRFRVIGWSRNQQLEPDAPVGEDDVRALLTSAFGTDFGLHEITWTSRFGCDERQVASYRDQRVLLVGDAAHAHSPAGAQGMNTGIQDAFNLGWKLAAALDDPGARADAVLDSYDAERRPVGRVVLRTSGLMIRAMVVRRLLLRALRTTLLHVVLGFPPSARRAALTFSGIGIRYARPRGSHRLTGTRVPDLPLHDGGRLFEALRHPGPTLVLERDAAAGVTSDGTARVVRRADAGPALLVRPDGYVGWAGASAERLFPATAGRVVGDGDVALAQALGSEPVRAR